MRDVARPGKDAMPGSGIILSPTARRSIALFSVGTVLLLIVIGVVSHASFAAPVIYSDDWSSFIKPMVDGHVPWLDWTSRRPL